MSFDKYNAIRIDQINAYYSVLEPTLNDLVAEGYSLNQICDYLNNDNIKTATGSNWTIQTLHRVLKKMGLKTIYSQGAVVSEGVTQ